MTKQWRFWQRVGSGGVLAVLASALLLTLAVGVAGAADETTPPAGPDPSGLTIGSAADLAGVAPGTLTADDITAAQTSEPFAYNLATLVSQNRLGINFTWTLIAGFLVMFMQLGFALVETGFCRLKNAAHTMTMNFVVYAVGMLGYFLVGFAFQFGGVGAGGVPNLGGLTLLGNELTIPLGGVDWGIIGYKGFMLSDGTYDVAVAVLFLFQMVFMDTAATIPTGAMAERWKFSAFLIYGLFLSMIIYPIFGNWAWGGGWLSQLGKIGLGGGYADFAGSGVVHSVGGFTALAGAMVLGPRLGKYNRDGTSNAIPGHSLVLGLAGALILGFGWFGFNPGSTLGASGNGALRIGIIATSTMLASMTGALVALLWSYVTTKKWDPGMTANGFLAGLVAITAPSGYVSPLSAFIIGAIAGAILSLSIPFVDKILKVDDPVGAISVHGTCGIWGVLAVGIFADGTSNYAGTSISGLIAGDVGQLGAQIIGAIVVMAWSFGTAYAFFRVLNAVMNMRVSPETELAGLDIPEMGALAYPTDWEPADYAGKAPAARQPGLATGVS
jgi:Amt family ammonium transporter